MTILYTILVLLAAVLVTTITSLYNLTTGIYIVIRLAKKSYWLVFLVYFKIYDWKLTLTFQARPFHTWPCSTSKAICRSSSFLPSRKLIIINTSIMKWNLLWFSVSFYLYLTYFYSNILLNLTRILVLNSSSDLNYSGNVICIYLYLRYVF